MTGDLAADVREAGLAAGLDRIGFASAAPMIETRSHLRERKALGLHGGMAFTYRNPERSTDPGRTVPGARTLVVGARSYRCQDKSRPAGGPWARVARYAWVDHYAPLRTGLEAAAAPLRRAGFSATVLVDDNALVDREAAARAGLGWFGKHSNLLVPGAGSWFVLGSVVTDADLLADDRRVPDGCGSCQRCLPACPTGAIVEPGVIDARRCLAWLVQAPGIFPRQYRASLGDRIYGCDDCQDACPLNRPKGALPAPPERARAWVDAVAMLSLDDRALLDAAGRWYVARREPRYLRRNLIIVIGNIGSADDPGVADSIGRALRDPDPIVRGHAVWAAARLGRPEWADGLHASERDPFVRSELDARPEARATPRR